MGVRMKPAKQLWIKSGIVFAALGMSLFATRPAEAVPSFARQTGMACEACHTVFPELTPFGRLFKLNGYTITNIGQVTATTPQQSPTLALNQIPPISAMIQFSDSHLNKTRPDANFATHRQQNDTIQFPQQLSLFYAGEIAPKVGAFAQVTMSQTGGFGMDNTDVRFANQGMIGGHNFIYGVTANNNPTVQDVWNSTPAFGYPYVSNDSDNNIGFPKSPVAAQIDGSLGQEVAGIGPYIYVPDAIAGGSIYAEVSGYRTAHSATFGPYDSSSSSVISGVAPYWRLAWEKDWGRNSFEIGTYGMALNVYNNNGLNLPLSGASDSFTDVAGDAQYQYIGTNNIFSVAATGIHENQDWKESFAQGKTSNSSDTLDTVRITGSWYYQRRYGAIAQFFDTWGTADPTLYTTGATDGTNSANGSPNTNGVMLQADYMPWENTRLIAQYTIYNKYLGASSNYDGNGRNASDNNLLYLGMWVAF